jgi:taurine dioxygenase
MIFSDAGGTVLDCADGTRLHVTPLGVAYGARITGLDLSQPLHPSVAKALDHAFTTWHLLCFPDQDLQPADEIRALQYFDDAIYPHGDVLAHTVPGYPELQILSNIEVDGKPTGYTNKQGMEWHSDLSGMPIMPKASQMYAIEVPESGGETYFADGALAFETLPGDIREQLDGLESTFSWVAVQRYLAEASGGSWDAYDQATAAKHPNVVRPLVRVHPVTGRKSLFISEREIVAISGLDAEDTQALLRKLMAHITETPYVVYRHTWSPGELVVWDNRCLIHSVCEYNYEGQRRIMHQLNGADSTSAEQTIAIIPVAAPA